MIEKALVVARKEILENLKSARYWGIVAIFILFYLAAASYAGFAVRGFAGMATFTRAAFELGNQAVTTFQYVAPILGIALGFSAIAAEREKGTIRLVLSRPIFRDDFINGKVIAAVCLITLALGVSTAVSLPLAVIVQGINLTGEDLVRLLLLLLPATLLALVYYAMALFVSVLSSRSGQALVISLVVWIFFTFILPIVASLIAFQVLGPPPAFTGRPNATTPGVPGQEPSPVAQYRTQLNRITSSVQFFSPNARFSSVANAIFARQRTLAGSFAYVSIADALSRGWLDLTILAAYTAVFIALSYVVFLRRQEVR
ncbi:MAG: ABC transporter permease subunit [Thermofilum sp.]